MLLRATSEWRGSGVRQLGLLTIRPAPGTPSYLHVVCALEKPASGAQLCRDVLEGNWSLVDRAGGGRLGGSRWQQLWEQIAREWDLAFEAPERVHTPRFGSFQMHADGDGDGIPGPSMCARQTERARAARGNAAARKERWHHPAG